MAINMWKKKKKGRTLRHFIMRYYEYQKHENFSCYKKLMFIFNAEKKMRENWRVFSYVVTEPESPLRDSIPTLRSVNSRTKNLLRWISVLIRRRK